MFQLLNSFFLAQTQSKNFKNDAHVFYIKDTDNIAIMLLSDFDFNFNFNLLDEQLK